MIRAAAAAVSGARRTRLVRARPPRLSQRLRQQHEHSFRRRPSRRRRARLGFRSEPRSTTASPLQATPVAGEHPGSGDRLAERRPRRAGFDLTLRAPKSVSLLHALGDPGPSFSRPRRRAHCDVRPLRLRAAAASHAQAGKLGQDAPVGAYPRGHRAGDDRRRPCGALCRLRARRLQLAGERAWTRRAGCPHCAPYVHASGGKIVVSTTVHEPPDAPLALARRALERALATGEGAWPAGRSDATRGCRAMSFASRTGP